MSKTRIQVSKPGEPLTKRQIETLRHIFQGKTSDEVAAAMFVTKRTVDFHLFHAYRKLGARNRIEAYRACALKGLL